MFAGNRTQVGRPTQPQITRQSPSPRAQQAQSRRQSQSQILTQPSPPHSQYECVRRDIRKIMNKPEPSDAAEFDKRKQINLRKLLPYTRFTNPFPKNQLLVYGRLTLVSRTPAKTLLIEPDSTLWPYLTPLKVAINDIGLPTDQSKITCAGLGGPLTVCSDDLLREGIFVFKECDLPLVDMQKLRKNPPEVVYVKQPPRNVNILMVGYSQDDSSSITSHSITSRKEYKYTLRPGRKLKWGASDIRTSRIAWAEEDAITADKELLVCFRGAKDEYSTDVKASYVRSIIARSDKKA